MAEQIFPEWAPPQIVDLWRKELASCPSDVCGVGKMLERLLTWDDMKKAWRLLEDKSVSLDRDVEFDLKKIGYVCIIGFCGPTKKTEALSSSIHGKAAASPRDKMKVEIFNTAKRLADMVRETGLNQHMVCFPGFDIKDKADAAAKKTAEEVVYGGIAKAFGVEGAEKLIEAKNNRVNDWMPIAGFLDCLAESASDVIDCNDIEMPSPTDSKMGRAYLARYLTQEIMELFGDRDPMRPVVVQFIRAAMNDTNFEDSQLSRLAPIN